MHSQTRSSKSEASLALFHPLNIFLPAICRYTSSPPLLSPHPNSPPLLFFSFLFSSRQPPPPSIISRDPATPTPRVGPEQNCQQQHDNAGENCTQTARCNYNMPFFFLIYPSICPASNRITPPPPPRSIFSCLLQQSAVAIAARLLSRLPSQPPKYKPWDPASVGRQPARPPAISPIEEPYLGERSANGWGGG